MGVCREGLGRHMNSAGSPPRHPLCCPGTSSGELNVCPVSACVCGAPQASIGPVVLVSCPPPGIAWQRKQVSVGLGFRKASRTWAPAEPQPRAGLRAKVSYLERSSSRGALMTLGERALNFESALKSEAKRS